MEDECHELDVEIVAEDDSRERGGPSYSHYVDDCARARSLAEQVHGKAREIYIIL